MSVKSENHDSSHCKACGYDLGETIELATAHNEICPSCGIQYGYSDSAGGSLERRLRIYQLWREAWIANNKQPLPKDQKLQVISRAMNEIDR
jgi:hypothetical protein